MQTNDDFLLEAGEDEPIDMDAVLPQVKNSEDSMAIDEEGRPKFAPAKDTVWIWLIFSFHDLTLTQNRYRIPSRGLKLERSPSHHTE